MALSQIAVPNTPPKKGKGGLLSNIGAGLGAVIGTVGGAVAGGPAGAFAGATTGYGIGSQIGQAGGEAMDPGKGAGNAPTSINTQQSSAVDRKLAGDPMLAAATVNESLAAIQRADERTRAVYEPFLIAAKRNLETRIG